MPKSYLWGLDEKGDVLFLSSWDSYWQKIDSSVSKINQFKAVSASLWSIWCIGIDNEIYLYVPSPEIKIRAPDRIMENQRKEFNKYSGQNLKAKDPPEFAYSNYYGKLVSCDLKSYPLPSTRWKWEDIWKIKKSYNGELTEEGWIYSSSFLQKFQIHSNRMSNSVRRRFWQRYRYYHASERWLFIGQDSAPFKITCNQDCGVDGDDVDSSNDYSMCGIIAIACGGEMLPHQKDGYVSVWTINENGQILYRLDVYRQNPEGSNWCLVKLPKFANAICLSVGPLGHLLVYCSNGMIYFRENLTWKNPIGSSWANINPPEDLSSDETIVQLTMSVYAIWARSSHNRVWFRSNVNLHETATGTYWTLVANNIVWICSSPSGQFWGIAKNGNGVLYRLSSSKSNNTDRFWSGYLQLGVGLGDQSESTRLVSVCADGLFIEDDRLPCAWLQSPVGGPRTICVDCDWRTKIMDSLNSRDSDEFKNPSFSNYTSLSEQVSWSKASYCEAQSVHNKSLSCRWLPTNVVLHHKLKDNRTIATMHVNITKVGKSTHDIISFIESDEMLCASKYSLSCKGKVMEQCCTLAVYVRKKEYKSSPNMDDHHRLVISRLLLKLSSETEVEDWILALNFVMRADRPNYIDRTDVSKIWLLNQLYEPFYTNSNERERRLNRCYQNGGHFKMIESCAKGRITWALGFNGIAWVHSNGWGGSYLGLLCSSKDNLHTTFDVRSITVMEHEKLKLMPGFAFGKFFHYMWSDEYGNIVRDKESIQLASRRWQWCGNWLVDHSIDHCECDQEGWQYSTSLTHKFDSNLTWNKSFRRRKWTRSYKTSMTGPWKEVLSDLIKIKDISISSEYSNGLSDNFKCVVWAATETGVLLRRKGVTITCPEGFEWIQIRTDLKVVSVSVNKECDLWVVCNYGSIWRLRQAINKTTTHINDLDWQVIKHSNPDGRFIMVSSGDRLSLWAIDSNYHLWTRMFNNTGTPIGDLWVHVCDQVSHVSCNFHQKVFVIFTSGTLAERMGVSYKVPQGTHWRYDMNGFASYVSIRGA